MSPDRTLKETHVVERSWFGDMRHVASEASVTLPAHIALHRDSVFTTHLSLPAEAANSFHKAATLRLAEISPIPAEDAAVAVGKITMDAEGRTCAKIAITRKRYLREVREQYGKGTISAIAAASGDNSALEFVFSQERATLQNASRQGLIASTLLAASILFLIVAIDIHQDHRMQALHDRETEALAALRALRCHYSTKLTRPGWKPPPAAQSVKQPVL